jgi:hypothetical protein
MKKTEEEKRFNIAHWSGRAASLEDAAGQASAKASAEYGNRSDNAASHWRAVSDWLEELAAKERLFQKKLETGEAT